MLGFGYYYKRKMELNNLTKGLSIELFDSKNEAFIELMNQKSESTFAELLKMFNDPRESDGNILHASILALGKSINESSRNTFMGM